MFNFLPQESREKTENECTLPVQVYKGEVESESMRYRLSQGENRHEKLTKYVICEVNNGTNTTLKKQMNKHIKIGTHLTLKEFRKQRSRSRGSCSGPYIIYE